MDPASCSDFLRPDPRLLLEALGSGPEGEPRGWLDHVERLSSLRAQGRALTPPRVCHKRRQSWPGLLATPALGDSLAFISQLVGQEQGSGVRTSSTCIHQSPSRLACFGCGGEHSGCIQCVWGRNWTGAVDLIDLLRMWEDVSLLQDFF